MWDRKTIIYVDSVTEEEMRLGNARVRVEVNADSRIPKVIELDVEGGKTIIVVAEYPFYEKRRLN
jgi:hypothetical protein